MFSKCCKSARDGNLRLMRAEAKSLDRSYMLLVAICGHDGNLSLSLLSRVGQASCMQPFGNP
jgi:hypothetical protein